MIVLNMSKEDYVRFVNWLEGKDDGKEPLDITQIMDQLETAIYDPDLSLLQQH